MAKGEDVSRFSAKHALPIVSIEELVMYRREREFVKQ